MWCNIIVVIIIIIGLDGGEDVGIYYYCSVVVTLWS